MMAQCTACTQIKSVYGVPSHTGPYKSKVGGPGVEASLLGFKGHIAPSAGLANHNKQTGGRD